MEIGMAGESTAIGEALALAANRLKDIKSKSKIMILLTDGTNTAGRIDPIQAAKVAQALDIKIYAIGVGSHGPVPIATQFGYQQIRVDMDEKTLKEVSSLTGGKYFRAKDTQSLVDVYATIDQLEKSEVEVKVFHNYEEKYSIFLWSGLVFLLFEILFGMSRFRRIP